MTEGHETVQRQVKGAGVIHRNRYHLFALVSLALVCTAIYGHTLHAPFVLDDYYHITQNPHIRVTDLNPAALYAAAFDSPSSRRAVANLSFALNYYFSGYNVVGYHLVNIAVHFINGVLVYLLAGVLFRLLLGPSPARETDSPGTTAHRQEAPSTGFIAMATALIFVAHPLQTESVTYIVQRMNSLATMFYLLAFLLYLYGRLSRDRWRIGVLLAGSCMAWGLALGTKEIAATLPLVILVSELYFFSDPRQGRGVKRNLAFLVVLMALLFAVSYLYFGGSPLNSIDVSYRDRDFTMVQRVLTQFRVIIFYLGLTLLPLPSRLSLHHTITASTSLLEPVTTLLSLCAMALLLGFAIVASKRSRVVSFCILWFFIHLAIESSVIGLEMVFEHRLYLPSVGIALLVSYAAFCLPRRSSLAVITIALIVTGLGTATVVRNDVWSDRIALWTDVIAKSPKSARGHAILATIMRERGSSKTAAQHYDRAVALDPAYVAKAHNRKGYALYTQGLLDEAMVHFVNAIGLQPEYANAHNNLGVILSARGRFDEAVRHFSIALASSPDNPRVQVNLERARQRLLSVSPSDAATPAGPGSGLTNQ